MEKISVHDTHEDDSLVDLREVLEALGQPALDAFWTVGTSEPLEALSYGPQPLQEQKSWLDQAHG